MSGSLAVMLLAVTAAGVLLPLALLLADALPRDLAELDALRDRLTGAPLQSAFLRSMAVALLACGVASLLAVPIAFIGARAAPWARWSIILLGAVPLVLPAFVSAALLDQFAPVYNQVVGSAPFGALEVRGSSIALVIVYAIHYLPLILLGLIAGLRGVDRSFEESAVNLGAGRLTVWRRIILPLATPGYLLGTGLMMLKILEDVGTPLILGIDGMLAPQVLVRLGAGGPGDPQLQVTALVLLAVSLIVTALAWSALLPARAVAETCVQATRWRSRLVAPVATALAVTLLGLIALAPLAGLALLTLGADWTTGPLPTGFDLTALHELPRRATDGVQPTALIALGSGLLTLLLGAAFAILTAGNGPLARFMRFVATTLFSLPGVVLALAYLQLADRFGLAADHAPQLAWGALMLVVVFRQLPLARRLLQPRIRTLRRGRLDAARALGAGASRLYLGIALPALAGALGAVFLLGAVAATLELSAALVLIEDPQAPYALALYTAIQGGGSISAWAVKASLLVLLTAAAFALAAALLRRRCSRLPTSDAHHAPVLRGTS